MLNRVRLLSALLAGLPIAASAERAVPRVKPSSAFESSVQPFLKKNCYGCHNTSMAAGGLNLLTYKTADAAFHDPERWEHVMQRLRTGEMPPKPLPRPKAEEVKAVTDWIQAEVERADKLLPPDPGHVTARRLNRAEYNNTIRDLVGLDLDVANEFPQDNSAYGFDNVSEALSISPLLMEKYMAAGEKIARLAVFGPELKKPSTVRFTPTLPRRMEINPVVLEEAPYYSLTNYDETGLSHPGAFHAKHRFPADGEYLFRFVPNGSRPAGAEPQQFVIYLDGKPVHTFAEVRQSKTITNETQPVPHEVRLQVTAGLHTINAAFPKLFEGLPPAYSGPNPSKLPQPEPPNPERFMPPLSKDATPKQIEERNARIARIRERLSKPKFDGLAVGLVEVVGPFEHTKGPLAASVKKIFVCSHSEGQHQPSCERKVVSSLARRAFRRPVSLEEVNDLVAISSSARERGRTFEQGIALALQTILVSPDFLFRMERSAATASAPTRIGQFELASRLSYFLWSSMPDDELLRQASQGALRQPAVLRTQVQRMLKDPKAEAFVSNFVGQWLETRRLEAAQPDRDRFPDFDDHLRDSMARETELFFANLLQQDGSVLDLLQGEYTFVNERLARHYNLKDVKGPEFRRISLAGTGRAGILTQGSVLTVSSYNNRTSPVLRGKWILENLLNAPPPPPPPDVPALDEAAVGSAGTLRQQMEKHRANPVCSSCHARMDPLGFALENYNAVGLWRTQDGKFTIDPSGTLPDGQTLKGAEDLKRVLANDREAFTKGLTEKLLVYAVGRGVARSDRAAVNKIAAGVAAKEYRFSSLILGIVNSVPFQMQRGERAKS